VSGGWEGGRGWLGGGGGGGGVKFWVQGFLGVFVGSPRDFFEF